MRLLRTFAALSAVLLLALPAAAQEQRGSIEGVMKDTSGAVLPGVAVEARTNTGVVLTATTDAAGTYRFPSVAPGTYEISASLQGFSAKKQGNIDVGLGQVKKVDLALSLQGVSESVQVTAESPLVDVQQSARQTNIAREQIALLPKGRDFTSLVTQAPGANSESKLGGLSIDGASAGENRYIIDGIETTNLQSGMSGKNVIADFVDEIQVKSSGYTAEFGGATGGVINVITKSGTNNWHGNAALQWQGDKLSGGSSPAAGQTTISTGVPTLRISLTDSTKSEYVTYPEGSGEPARTRRRVGWAHRQQSAWFFGAYQPALTTTKRDVNPTTAVNPNAGTFSVRAHPAGAVRDRKYHVAAGGQSARSGRLQQQLEPHQGSAAVVRGHGPHRHELQQDLDVPELFGVRQPRLGRVAKALLRRARRLLHVGSARHQRHGAAALPIRQHQQRGLPGRAGEPAEAGRVHQHSVE